MILQNKISSGLLWAGQSGISLGKLSSKESRIIKLSVIPLQTGLLVRKL